MRLFRVLLVDAHTLFRKGIASLLSADGGFEIVGEASNGHEALEKARDLMPDVILMDICMPGTNGLEAMRRIKAEIPSVRIVILTVSEEDQNLFEAIKGGAIGYLLKKTEPQGLFSILRGVMHGEVPVSGVMAKKLLGEFARRAQPVATLPGTVGVLTARERDVLELLTHGKAYHEIASSLGVAENTVRKLLENILEKLHLGNRIQAARREGSVDGHPETADPPMA